MRIAICDDDALTIEQITNYIKSYFKSIHMKCPELISFSCGEDLLSDKTEKDIVFLDIEMPGMNGIYVGKELKKLNKNIIIFVVTSYSEYLDEAMRFQVFRYLSKPIERQRFFRNLKDALYYYNTITIEVPIETKNGIFIIPASQIIAIEAQGKKIIIHTSECSFYSTRTMNYWLEHLPKNCFYQTHRSFIVNFKHITDFDHSTIHLANQQITAYLTRRKYSSFKNAYLLYLESTR